MSLRSTFSKLALATLFPQTCVICRCWTSNSTLSPLCPDCFSGLTRLDRRICHFCGIPVPGDLLDPFAVCSSCRKTPLSFSWARAWGRYEGDLRRVIRKFKFDGLRQLSHPLASLLCACFSESGFTQRFDFVIPVPSHPRRRRQRGFDHTFRLANAFSRQTGIPLFQGLERIRHTLPQFGLDRKERHRNLRGAFALDRGPLLRGRNLIVIDDILTTATTVTEIADLLRHQADPSDILVLVLARPLLAFTG